jgi:hypothetical protein
MKHLLAVIALITAFGCATSQLVTYRPSGSSETSWQIMVNKSAGGATFQLTINGAAVIEKSTSPVTNSLAARADYQGHEVILVVTYSSGILGIGTGHEAHVFIDNELAAKLKL